VLESLPLKTGGDAKLGVRKVARQNPAARTEGCHAEWVQEIDGDQPYFERIAGLRALDEDRSRHRMRTGTSIGDAALDGPQRGRYLGVGHTSQLQPLDAPRHHRLHPHAVARRHPQRRLDARVVVAPVHVLSGEREIVDSAAALRQPDGREENNHPGPEHAASHLSLPRPSARASTIVLVSTRQPTPPFPTVFT
jgi:hypothetical protein